MRHLTHGVAALAVATALVGCGEQFKPGSYVDKLRVLAIKAENPEIAPVGNPDGFPDSTELTALVSDPKQLDDPAREATTLYLGCTPDPLSLEQNVCTALETLASPEILGQMLAAGDPSCSGGGAGGMGGGEGGPTIAFAGLERCTQEEGCGAATVDLGGGPTTLPAPLYALPEGFTLDTLPAGAPARTLGVQAVVLAITVQASPQELVEGADPADACAFSAKVGQNLAALMESREEITSVKRIQIRGPDAVDPLNVNPAIAGLTARGASLPMPLPDPVPAEASFGVGEKADLLPLLPVDGSGAPIPEEQLYQPYTRYDENGKKLQEDEEAWLWSWYSTAGELEDERTRGPQVPEKWTAPDGSKDYPLPASNRVFVYSVVRDARGGIDWAVREVRIAR